jgi:hypothetical protein
MKTLEKKIKDNKSLIEKKFLEKNLNISQTKGDLKMGHSKSWDNGWGNYGKTYKPVNPGTLKSAK